MPSINPTLKKQLYHGSVLPLTPLYTDSEIAHFNTQFDHIFEGQHKKRRYVDALNMHNLGLLDNIFTPKLISLMFSLFHEPILYHCHSYEIDGLDPKPHIAGDNFLNGWHRDIDCMHDLNNRDIQHVSLFVYLTDVDADDGAFEVCDKGLSYFPKLFRSSNFFRMVGKSGSSFLFNRTSVHRASPNINSTKRRVLKISFQDRNTPSRKLNEKIPAHDKHFKLNLVRDSLKQEDQILKFLFGADGINRNSLNLALSEKLVVKQTPNTLSCMPYKIHKKMSLLQEFRGYAKDLVYIKNLLLNLVKQNREPY